jgi:hypothetical protein
MDDIKYKLKGDSLFEAWTRSLKCFGDKQVVGLTQSSIGMCYEIQNLSILVDSPSTYDLFDDPIPETLKPMIVDFSKKLISEQYDIVSTTNSRLYKYKTASGSKINQVDIIIDKLRKNQNSRHAIINFWDPEIDLVNGKPVSPLVASYRIIDNKLCSTVIARSVDAWTGALPIFQGFIDLQERITKRLRKTCGSVEFFSLSYHMYTYDELISRKYYEEE